VLFRCRCGGVGGEWTVLPTITSAYLRELFARFGRSQAEPAAGTLCHDEAVTEDFEPALVPELLVTDLHRSIEFWCGACGFELRYSRPEERFAYIALGKAHVMLEQVGVGRNWVTSELEAPLGRGINFQISVPDTGEIVKTLELAGVELFMQPETRWYQMVDDEAGVKQFLVTDPDGYLIRFQSSIGRRPIVR
jgi:catechol 2,3-dioxygenase-like lactoylglutathione lyase family enzyme